MNHSASARALAQLTVLPQLYRGVAQIGIGIHEESDRSVGVERFAATKLLLLFLQIAIGDIEADRVTENVIECTVRTDIFRARADHDGKLNFKLGLVLRKRHFDRAVMCQERTGPLEPN